ncbi:uncharacterized protein LOC144439002 [Glandiceps talaboti]
MAEGGQSMSSCCDNDLPNTGREWRQNNPYRSDRTSDIPRLSALLPGTDDETHIGLESPHSTFNSEHCQVKDKPFLPHHLQNVENRSHFKGLNDQSLSKEVEQMERWVAKLRSEMDANEQTRSDCDKALRELQGTAKHIFRVVDATLNLYTESAGKQTEGVTRLHELCIDLQMMQYRGNEANDEVKQEMKTLRHRVGKLDNLHQTEVEKLKMENKDLNDKYNKLRDEIPAMITHATLPLTTMLNMTTDNLQRQMDRMNDMLRDSPKSSHVQPSPPVNVHIENKPNTSVSVPVTIPCHGASSSVTPQPNSLGMHVPADRHKVSKAEEPRFTVDESKPANASYLCAQSHSQPAFTITDEAGIRDSLTDGTQRKSPVCMSSETEDASIGKPPDLLTD